MSSYLVIQLFSNEYILNIFNNSNRSHYGGELLFEFQICKDKKEPLTIATSKRIENIIRCSEIYKDCFHEKLQSEYDANEDLRLFVHKTCVDTYVHLKNGYKILKRQADDDEKSETTNLPKRAQRSATPLYFLWGRL